MELPGGFKFKYVLEEPVEVRLGGYCSPRHRHAC